MIRMGCFTGKLYDSSVDVSTIKECWEIISYYDPLSNLYSELAGKPISEDEAFLNRKRAQLKAKCLGCTECEESRKYISVADIEYPPMSEDDALAVMQKILDSTDNEDTCHRKADKLLCRVLIGFKCDRLVKLFDSIEKWYS